MYTLPPHYKANSAFDLEQMEAIWSEFKAHLVQ